MYVIEVYPVVGGKSIVPAGVAGGSAGGCAHFQRDSSFANSRRRVIRRSRLIPTATEHLLRSGPLTKNGLTAPEKVEICTGKILQTQGVPPFGEHADQVLTSTMDLDGETAILTRTIMKDLGLASQILRLANSALYNRSGRPILSVTHAVTLVGWETIRNLVGAIRYMEHFAKRSPGLRELMFLSVLTATHAREVAAAVGYPKPEEAYVCGLFRSLGEVLMACHFPNEYSSVILAMHEEKLKEREACLKVLGFSWDEVGAEVAGSWNMPGKVRSCLGAGDAGADIRQLVSITNYGHSLTHALYRDGARFDQIHLRTLIDQRGVLSTLPQKDLRRLIKHSLEDAQRTFAALRISTDLLLLDHQADQAREILRRTPALHPDGLKALDEAILEANRTLRQGEFELTGFIQALLGAVQGAGFDTTIFGLVNEDRSAIRGRLGCGQNIEENLRRFQFPMNEADGQIIAMQRKVDVLIDRARDDRYDTSTMVMALQPSSFALFPIVVNEIVAGCLYCSLAGSAPDLELARVPLMRARDAIAQAIRKTAGRQA